jgi:hypothetical protein
MNTSAKRFVVIMRPVWHSYVLLDPLRVGNHMLHFHAENSSESPVFTGDVTYNLTFVQVLRK